MNTQLEIPPALTLRLAKAAQARGETLTDFVLHTLADTLPAEDNNPAPSGARHLHERLSTLAASVAADEIGKLPRDGAEKHDFYSQRQGEAGS